MSWLEGWILQWSFFGRLFKNKFNQYLNEISSTELKNDIKFGYLYYDINYNSYIIDTNILVDFIISAVYRDLQYGYPPCEEDFIKETNDNCKRARELKLTYIYLIMATLDDLLKDQEKTGLLMLKSLVDNLGDKSYELLWVSIKRRIFDLYNELRNINITPDDIKNTTDKILSNKRKKDSTLLTGINFTEP